jgi:hypothetical protein
MNDDGRQRLVIVLSARAVFLELLLKDAKRLEFLRARIGDAMPILLSEDSTKPRREEVPLGLRARRVLGPLMALRVLFADREDSAPHQEETKPDGGRTMPPSSHGFASP